MLIVRFINEHGNMVSKTFDSPYFCRKFIEKAKRSKRITLVSYPNIK